MSKKLIINADDMGLRESINKGIITAYKNGVVKSVSLTVEGDGVEDAIRQLKENPCLGTGAHINMDKFFNIDHGRGSVMGFISPKPSPEEIRGEIRRQIEKYFSFGLPCDHLDSHHHSHLNQEVFPLVCEVAKEFKIPFVRLPQKIFSNYSDFEHLKKILESNGVRFIDHFIEGWYWGNVDENYKIAELMTHPGYGELWREAELAHCCQPQLKQYFTDQKIELIKFADLL